MPQLVEKTYKPAVAGRKSRKRPFSKAVLKHVGEGGERTMPTLFAALYSDNIKQIKAAAGNKENSVKTRLRSSSRHRPLQPLGNSFVNKMNIIVEEAEFELDSSFDELRKGPRRESERTPFWIRFRGWKGCNVPVSPRDVNFQPVRYEAEPRRRLCDWQHKPSLPLLPQSPDLSSPGELTDPSWGVTKKTARKAFLSKQRRKLIAKKKKKDLPDSEEDEPSDSEEDEPLILLKHRSKPTLMRTRVRKRTGKGRLEPSVPHLCKDETESCEKMSIEHCSKQTCASDDPFVSEEENPVTAQSPDVKEVPEVRVSSESRQSIEVQRIAEQTVLSTGGQQARVLQAGKSEKILSLTQSGFVQTDLCTEGQDGQETRVLRTRKSEEIPRLTESGFVQASSCTGEEGSRVLQTRQSEEDARLTRSEFVKTSSCTEGQESRVLQPRKSEDVPRLTRTGFVQTSLCNERQDGQETRVLRTRKSEDVPRLTRTGFVQTSLCNERQDGQETKVLRARKSEEVPRLRESGFLRSRQSSRVQKTHSSTEDEEQGVKSEDICDMQDDKVSVISPESDRDSESLRRLSQQLQVVLTPLRFSYSSGEEKETMDSNDIFHSKEGDVPVTEECSTGEDEKYSPRKQFSKEHDSAVENVSNSSDFIEESPSPVSLGTNRTLSARRMFHTSVDTVLFARRKTYNRGPSRHTISVGQRARVLSEMTANDMNLGEVVEESELKQIQPGEIMEEVLEESEPKQIQPGEIMEEVLEESEPKQIQPDSSRVTHHIHRRSRHVVSMGHRTLLRDRTANDLSLEQVLEESESEQMNADDAVDSRRRSYSRRRSRLTVVPEPNSNNTSLEQILDESESEENHPVSVSCLDMSLMHRSMSHRMVFPMSRSSAVEDKSLGFRDVFVNSSLSVLRDVSTVASDSSRSSVGNEVLDEVEPVITARDVVLQRCKQTEPLLFSEAFPDWCLEKCKKIGEGVYGEVFSLERPDSAPSVLKIIPIEGELAVNGEPQKTYEEILSEIVIAMELSELRHGTNFCTTGFSELIRCWCVQGKYPSRLLSLWFEFDKEKGSENDAPDVFSDEQLFIVLELANAGTDLESYVLNSAEQALAVFAQVTNSLAVAEAALQFEHRDLHWGNILIKPTTEKTRRFVLDGEEYNVPTKGLQVTIIDFTLSRMTYDGCSIYNDLAQDPSLFTSHGDFQFEVYRLMKSTVENDWQLFRPYTNVLWLRYVLDKMETGVCYRRKNTKTHKSSLSELRRLKKGILDSACSIAVMKSNLVSV